MVRTSVSSTDGESLQPERFAGATTSDGAGRRRGPCRQVRMDRAVLTSARVGWGNDGNGDLSWYFLYESHFLSRRERGVLRARRRDEEGPESVFGPLSGATASGSGKIFTFREGCCRRTGGAIISFVGWSWRSSLNASFFLRPKTNLVGEKREPRCRLLGGSGPKVVTFCHQCDRRSWADIMMS